MSELLDEEALNKLTKSDLVQYALKVSNLTNHINSLSAKLDSLTERFVKTESEIVLVKNSNALLKGQCELLESRLDRLERLQTQDSQYLRNNQIELKKFPEGIDDSNLKSKVCELLSITGLGVVPNDIDKCHRLSNKQNVILEFKERQKRDDVLRNRKNLKEKSVELEQIGCDKTMILESLTPTYSFLDFLCRKLKKDKYINQTWFFNGKLWLECVERDGGRKHNITHIHDLYNLFGVERVDSYITSR